MIKQNIWSRITNPQQRVIPTVAEGQAIPWFGEVGKGIQYKLPYGIDDLKNNGYIIEIP